MKNQSGGEYTTFDSKFIEEMEAVGLDAVPLKTRLYCYLRWCEQSGDYGCLIAGEEALAERFGTTPKAISEAFYRLQKDGLIEHVWCDKRIYRNKTKVWFSTVRLAGATTGIERIKVLKKGGRNAEVLDDSPYEMRQNYLTVRKELPHDEVETTSRQGSSHPCSTPMGNNNKINNKTHTTGAAQAAPACPSVCGSSKETSSPFDESPVGASVSIRPDATKTKNAADRRAYAVLGEWYKKFGWRGKPSAREAKVLKSALDGGWTTNEIEKALEWEKTHEFWGQKEPAQKLSDTALKQYDAATKGQDKTPKGVW